MTAIARMGSSDMLLLLLVAGAVIAVAIFAMSFAIKGKRSKRIKSVVSKHRGELGQRQAEQLNKPSAMRHRKQKGHVELAQKLVSLLNLQKLMSSGEIRENLAHAGMRGRNAVTVYLASRIVGAVVGFGVTLLMVGLMKKFPYPDFVRFVFAGVGAAAGFYLPRIILTSQAQKRQAEMTGVFPDTLDLMLICVESGLGIEMAFGRVTEEIMESSPILAQELGLTSAELAFLGDRRQAYENFAKRTGMPAVKALTTTLIQSEQYGTPVGLALKVLAQEKRDERLSAAEKKAAALPAKLTVPMIIFFLPVLFIVVIGPAAMQIGG